MALYVAALGHGPGTFGENNEWLRSSEYALFKLYPGHGAGVGATLETYHLRLLLQQLKHPKDGIVSSLRSAAGVSASERFLEIVSAIVLAPHTPSAHKVMMVEFNGWVDALMAREQSETSIYPGRDNSTKVAATCSHTQWLQSPWMPGQAITHAFLGRLTPSIGFGDDGEVDGSSLVFSLFCGHAGSTGSNYKRSEELAADGDSGSSDDEARLDVIRPDCTKPAGAVIGPMSAESVALLEYHRRAVEVYQASGAGGRGPNSPRGLSLNKSQRESLLLMTMKCANLSCFVRELCVADSWGYQFLEENMKQSRKERGRREGVTRTTTTDEALALAVAEYNIRQANILDRVVQPLFETFGVFMSPELRAEIAENSAVNSAAWRQRDRDHSLGEEGVQLHGKKAHHGGHIFLFDEPACSVREVLEKKLMTCSVGFMMATVYALSRWPLLVQPAQTFEDVEHAYENASSTARGQVLMLATTMAIIAAKCMVTARAGPSAVTTRALKVHVDVMRVIPLIVRPMSSIIRYTLMKAEFHVRSQRQFGVASINALANPLSRIPVVNGHSLTMHFISFLIFLMIPSSTRGESSQRNVLFHVLSHTMIYIMRAVVDNLATGPNALALGDLLVSIAVDTMVDVSIFLTLLVLALNTAAIVRLASGMVCMKQSLVTVLRQAPHVLCHLFDDSRQVAPVGPRRHRPDHDCRSVVAKFSKGRLMAKLC
jgi:hypothetical protein